MTNLFDLIIELRNQMTLGSKQSPFFTVFNKNESKKRKSNQEMNGFVREDIQTIGFTHNINSERYELSANCESPSKRARIEPELSLNMSSDLNRTRQKKNRFISLFHNSMNYFRGRSDTNEDNLQSENEAVVHNSYYNNELMPSSSGSNSRQTFSATTNESVVTNETTIRSNIKPFSHRFIPCFVKRSSNQNRKRRFINDSKERQQYQLLINKHITQNPTKPITEMSPFRKEDSPAVVPPVIDLTSEKSYASMSCSEQTSEPLYTRELLDNNSKINLINKIKIKSETKGMGARMVFNRFPNLFSSNQSTPKFNLINWKTSQVMPKTPESSEKCFPIQSLPETSKKFNNLIETKKDILNYDFVSDLRNSLKISTELEDRRISKSESILNGYQNKRLTDCQTLNAKLKTPIIRKELTPFIPYIGIDDKFEEEEEEEEEEDEEEETAPSDFPDLTPDMNREIDAALRPSPPDEVLSEGFTVQICRKDMETLKGLNWLNDEIINFYLALIVERGRNDNFPSVHAFNTFFYKKLKDNGPQSLKRWTRKVDVFANDFIFIPIHLGMHWCLAVIDFINKRIDYYDSMGGNNMDCIQSLKAWIQAESIDKKKCEFPMTEWSLEMVKDIPQQMNGSDCGMFSCKYAEYISRKARINFTQAHMPYFRRRMVYEILTKQLL